MPNLRSSGSTAPLIPENKQEDTNPELRIYPNPSKGQFYISSAINNLFFNVRIMDLNGKLVYVKNNIPNESPLDISELKASVYMIEIQNSANQIIRKKLVKTE